MDISQVIRLAVMLAETWGKYRKKRGDDKLEHAIRLVRDFEPKLVETEEKLTKTIEQIELVVEEFDRRGWDKLAGLAGGVSILGDKVQQAISRIRKRFEWLKSNTEPDEALKQLDGGE